MTKEYAFDIELRAAVRVFANSEQEARDLMHEHMDTMSCNGGAWPDGSPIVFEASINEHRVAHLYEVDGEEPTLHQAKPGLSTQ